MAFSSFDLETNDSLFYLGIGALNILGLLLTLIGTFQAQQMLAAGAVIFTLMYLSFHAFQFQLRRQSQIPLVKEYIDSQFSDHRAMSFFFLAGFFGWYLLLASRGFSFLGSQVQSFVSAVPAMPQSVLFSSATAQLENEAFRLFANVITAGFVEEAFFLGLMPAIIITIAWRFGIRSKVTLTFLAALGSAALFASFHQQTTAFTQFWFAAFFFGLTLRGLAISDFLVDSVKGVAVFISFVIGAHIGNNMFVTGGIRNFVSVLSAEPLLLGLTFLVFGIYVVWSAQFLGEKVGVDL